MRRIELEENLGTFNEEGEHACSLRATFPEICLAETYVRIVSRLANSVRSQPFQISYVKLPLNFEPYHLTEELTAEATGAGHCAASPAPRLANQKARRPKY